MQFECRFYQIFYAFNADMKTMEDVFDTAMRDIYAAWKKAYPATNEELSMKCKTCETSNK